MAFMNPMFEVDPDVKPAIPFGQFFRRGMGTEYVAPFLYSMARMVRPTRLLEIGLGYTTPWLLRALDDNTDHTHIDRNCSPEYFRTPYEPLLLCMDDMSISDEKGIESVEALRDHRYLKLMETKFQGQAEAIKCDYGPLDFVWFDCGGPQEYEEFCEEYLPICSDYVFFHFTYSQGAKNKNGRIVDEHLTHSRAIGDDWYHVDIVEPHKYRQGSVTMIRRMQPQPAENESP